MFAASQSSDPLTQGDILADCPLIVFDTTQPTNDPSNIPLKRWRSTVVVLTQACDLAQGKVDKVLVAPIHNAEKLVEAGILKGNLIRDQMRRHLVFGWYFLPATATPVTMPESLVDLRDVHTVPRAILEQLIASGQRMASLTSPYREHLAQHFAVTYMRVALPEPYATQP